MHAAVIGNFFTHCVSRWQSFMHHRKRNKAWDTGGTQGKERESKDGVCSVLPCAHRGHSCHRLGHVLRSFHVATTAHCMVLDTGAQRQ